MDQTWHIHYSALKWEAEQGFWVKVDFLSCDKLINVVQKYLGLDLNIKIKR